MLFYLLLFTEVLFMIRDVGFANLYAFLMYTNNFNCSRKRSTLYYGNLVW